MACGDLRVTALFQVVGVCRGQLQTVLNARLGKTTNRSHERRIINVRI